MEAYQVFSRDSIVVENEETVIFAIVTDLRPKIPTFDSW
jgi:hypothetical protein